MSGQLLGVCGALVFQGICSIIGSADGEPFSQMMLPGPSKVGTRGLSQCIRMGLVERVEGDGGPWRLTEAGRRLARLAFPPDGKADPDDFV